MPPRNPHLPKSNHVTFTKISILENLKLLDNDQNAKERVLKMETSFRKSIEYHINSLPTSNAKLKTFNTNPFVLLFYCFKEGYKKISQIEGDILPAKLFSSMETSAGKMSEIITFPIYGWEIVESAMHTEDSAIDGAKLEGNVLKIATLKSGPRCLNDEMSENFADQIIGNAIGWAATHKIKEIDFTYGVLYGTQKQSNKKDWHILRNLMEKIPVEKFEILPTNRWDCTFTLEGVKVNASIKIGVEWWQYLGGKYGLLEVVIAIIRATIAPGEIDQDKYEYTIQDIGKIADISRMPKDYNVSILQKSQIPWLYFIFFHYCDELKEIDDELPLN